MKTLNILLCLTGIIATILSHNILLQNKIIMIIFCTIIMCFWFAVDPRDNIHYKLKQLEKELKNKQKQNK